MQEDIFDSNNSKRFIIIIFDYKTIMIKNDFTKNQSNKKEGLLNRNRDKIGEFPERDNLVLQSAPPFSNHSTTLTSQSL